MHRLSKSASFAAPLALVSALLTSAGFAAPLALVAAVAMSNEPRMFRMITSRSNRDEPRMLLMYERMCDYRDTRLSFEPIDSLIDSFMDSVIHLFH